MLSFEEGISHRKDRHLLKFIHELNYILFMDLLVFTFLQELKKIYPLFTFFPTTTVLSCWAKSDLPKNYWIATAVENGLDFLDACPKLYDLCHTDSHLIVPSGSTQPDEEGLSMCGSICSRLTVSDLVNKSFFVYLKAVFKLCLLFWNNHLQ